MQATVLVVLPGSAARARHPESRSVNTDSDDDHVDSEAHRWTRMSRPGTVTLKYLKLARLHAASVLGGSPVTVTGTQAVTGTAHGDGQTGKLLSAGGAWTSVNTSQCERAAALPQACRAAPRMRSI